jgi:hypothetical protein
MKYIIVSILVLFLTACAGTQIKSEDIRNANFESRPTQDETEAKIRVHLETVLIDPDSLRLSCNAPRKGWGRENMFDKPIFGYLVICSVNAKNRLGGYTGGKRHSYIFNGNYFKAFYSEYVGDGTGTHSGYLE